MTEKAKKSPAPLRLANAWRSLRAKARAYSRAMHKAGSEPGAYNEDLAEAREQELEQAALKFVKAVYDCNGCSWADLL